MKDFIKKQLEDIQNTLDAIPAQINHLNGAKHAFELMLQEIERQETETKEAMPGEQNNSESV